MRAINLRTEHMRNPIGIDVKQQYLTWNCLGGKEQSAYEIQIMEDGNVVWNSGKTNSSQMYVIYDGTVKSRQRYAWKLRLWDENDQVGEWSKEAYFETGILEKREWKAKWINPERTCDPEIHKPASYLKNTFVMDSQTLKKTRENGSGRLYVTAHGLYEAWIKKSR